MRRRERLTGFLIIFILLTFSAYSNSMNVGGRLNFPTAEEKGKTNNFQVQRNTSRTIKDSKEKIINTQKNINSTKENINENNKNNTEDNNSQKKNNSQITNNTASGEKNKDDKNTEVRNQSINSKIKNDREEKKVVKENRTVSKKEEKVFKKEEKELIEKVTVHKVESGETLWDIAHKHGLNIDSLIGANNISNMNAIKPGQKFKILPVKGIIYRVSPGESIASIADKFDLKAETIMEDNNIDSPSSLKIDQKLILRGATPEFSYKDRLDQKFMYPINTRITSYYGPRWGRMHEGIDFAAPMGSPIRAVSSGRVVYSGWASGYGRVVIIQHQRGLKTLYAHNSKLLVRNGESVGKGEVISRSGNTGNSTGPHLHFEVQVNGRPENPLNYIHR